MTKKALLKEALVMKYDVVKDDNLKPLQVKFFNYYYVIKKDVIRNVGSLITYLTSNF
jgi:hypothetical protein